MDTNINPDSHTSAGMAGGTALVLLNLTTLQLMETMLLAVLGATVSFTTSMALKWVVKQWKQKKGSAHR